MQTYAEPRTSQALQPVRARWRLVILLVLTVIAVHGVCLRDRFVNWDDEMMVLNNPRIMQFSPAGILHVFNPNTVYTDQFTEFYPVRDLSYMIDHALGGMHPFVYHLSNLLFEIANVVLLFLLFLKLFGDEPLALLSALIFAVHPLASGVVSWVASRKDLMAMTFYLLAFLAFVDFYRHSTAGRRGGQSDGSGETQSGGTHGGSSAGKYLVLSSFWFLAALLSKASALPFPGVLAAYLFIVERERSLKRYAVYLAVPVIMMILYTINLYSYSTSYFGTSTLQTVYSRDWLLMFMPELALIYTVHFLFPLNNAALYIEPSNQSMLEPLFVLSLPLLAGLVYAFFQWIRKDAVLFFGFVWILFNMVPASNIVGLQVKIADRFAYAALAGFGLMAGRLLIGAARGAARYKKYFITGTILVILPLSAVSFMLDLTWYDGVTLWTRQIQTRPYLPGVDKTLWGYAMLGNAYGEEGRYEKDKKYTAFVLEKNPDYVPSLKELGMVYAHEGEFGAAADLYQRALKSDLNLFKSSDYIVLGGLYEKMHEYRRAAEAYGNALRVPHPAYNDRGVTVKIQEMTEKIHEH